MYFPILLLYLNVLDFNIFKLRFYQYLTNTKNWSLESENATNQPQANFETRV